MSIDIWYLAHTVCNTEIFVASFL